MKPTFEDVLFLNGYPPDDYKKDSKLFQSHDLSSDEILKKVIINDLNGKYYQGFLKYFKYNCKDCLDTSSKSSKKSVELRISGNQLFQNNKHDSEIHEQIWKLYSQSIAFAPVESEELALAYGNRSYLLLHLKKYESCIQDIDRALVITKSDLLKIKLLCRKMSCFVYINCNRKEKEKLWTSIKTYFDKYDESSKDARLLKIVQEAKNDANKPSFNTKQDEYCSTKGIPVSQSKIHISYNKKYGKHATSTQDFATGDVVIVTKPVVTSVNLNKFYAYCSHCLSQMWAGIPCDECSLCMYCSENCKIEAWEKYHEVECKILPHINFDHSIFYRFQMSVRAIIMARKEISNISQLKEETQKIDSWRDMNTGRITNDVTFDSDFLNLYSLPTISSSAKDGIKLEFLLTHSKHACFLMAYMTQTCDIFERNVKTLKVEELIKDENFIFLCTLMVQLLMSAILYSEFVQSLSIQRLPCKKYSDLEVCTDNRCCLRGKYIELAEKNFQHSCNPNVSVCCTDDFGKILYYCTRPIQAKEKISISRFEEFWRKDRKQRKKMMDKIGYTCKCEACRGNWGTSDKLFESYSSLPITTQCKEDNLAEKYLTKHLSKKTLVEDEMTRLNEIEFRELAKDTNDILKICGQPSFLSSTMIPYLILAFERSNGVWPLLLPAEC